MIVLEGQPALSPFRRERLEARLRALHPGLRVAGAWWTYWVVPAEGAMPDAESLARILEAGMAVAECESGAVSRFVVPRLGTISPWASKATELLRGATLPIARVERGMRVDIAGWPADPALRAEAGKLLHDPMTQSLVAVRDGASALCVGPARAGSRRSSAPRRWRSTS